MQLVTYVWQIRFILCAIYKSDLPTFDAVTSWHDTLQQLYPTIYQLGTVEQIVSSFQQHCLLKFRKCCYFSFRALILSCGKGELRGKVATFQLNCLLSLSSINLSLQRDINFYLIETWRQNPLLIQLKFSRFWVQSNFHAIIEELTSTFRLLLLLYFKVASASKY